LSVCLIQRKKLDLPAPLVERGDFLRRWSRSLDRMRKTLPVSMRTRRVALASADDLPQALDARQLPIKQGQKLAFSCQRADARVSAVLVHKSLKRAPWNVLRNGVKDAILMPHGVVPLSCPVESPNPLDQVESMPCTSQSKISTGQPWIKSGHPGSLRPLILTLHDAVNMKVSPLSGRALGRSESFPIRICPSLRAIKYFPVTPAMTASSFVPGSAVATK